MSKICEITHCEGASGLIVDEKRIRIAASQVAADDDDRNVVLFDIGQKVCFFEYPTGNHDHALSAALQNDGQVAIEEAPLRLSIHQQRQVMCGGKPGLYTTNNREEEGSGETMAHPCKGRAPPGARGRAVHTGVKPRLLPPGPN